MNRSKFDKYMRLIINPCRFLNTLLMRFGSLLPNRLFLKIRYKQEMGERLNLDTPVKFTEKLQWLKLYNHRPEYTTMVDKYSVKDYVAESIGREYVIPTIGVWDNVEDIDFGLLPQQFVLKTTHGGGGCGVVICKDKSVFDASKAIAKLKTSLRQDIYRSNREWPYKNVCKRIIAEKYMEDIMVNRQLNGCNINRGGVFV